MPRFDDLADAALARLIDGDGQAVGTAFCVGKDVFLTCHHCVIGVDAPRLRSGSNDALAAQCDEEDRFAEVDLALLRCPDLSATPLPIVADAVVDHFWTKGFGWQSSSVRSAMPREGRVHGVMPLRYLVGEQEYDLHEALVLGETHSFDGGMSGSPVFDDEGVVVGVVNTKYKGGAALDGFAVTIRYAASRCEPLRVLLQQNRRSVPRYGRHLNGVGARRLCRAQAKRALGSLTASRRAQPDRYARRHLLLKRVREFLEDRRQILPVVGVSGAGKTAALAALAASPPGGRGVLLVEGSALAGDQRSLAAAVEVALAQPSAANGSAADLVADGLADDGERLLVLLDALNEAPAHLRASFGRWWGETAIWLREHDVQLIVTSRADFWPLVTRYVDPSLLAGEGVTLGDFDEAEAAEALALYELADRGLRPDDVRHPFLLEVYAELENEAPSGTLGRYQALDRYVQRKSELVSAAMAGQLSPSRVSRTLRRIATAMADAGGSHLPDDVLDKLCGSTPLEERLVSEHILVPVAAGGFSFAFDQVLEFLLADSTAGDANAVLAATLDAIRARDPEMPSASGLGQHVFAFLRLEQDAPEGFRDALRRLLEEIRSGGETGTRAQWRLHGVFIEAIAGARDPGQLTSELKDYADFVRVEWENSARFASTVQALALPIPERLEILRTLVRAEHYRGLRRQDYDGGGFDDVLQRDTSVVHVLDAVRREDPDVFFSCLRSWLEDTSKLRGGEATVADVATRFFTRYAPTLSDALLDALALGSERARLALFPVANSNPALGIALAQRYTAAARPDLWPAATRVAQAALRHASSEERQTVLAAVLSMYDALKATDDRQTKADALVLLMVYPESCESVADDALQMLEGEEAPSFVGFLPLLRCNSERVFIALMRRAEAHPDQTADILGALRHEPLSRQHEERLLALAERAHARSELSDTALAVVVESRLDLMRDEPPSERLARLARELLANPKTRSVIRGFVEGPDQSGEAARAFQHALADALDETPRSP